MLECVFSLKILFTTVLWVTPLVAPRCLFERLGFPDTYPDIFIRLLGAAYLALLVGYLLGLQSLHQGVYPAATVWVGVVSNGVACTILALHVFRGTWRQWGLLARGAMWFSLGATFLITTGLVWYGPVSH